MKIKDLFRHCDESRLFVMSDLHYNHKNVIKMDNRNFDSIEDMNTSILNELKEKLKPDDVLFDLGDLFWRCDIGVCRDFLDNIPTKNIYKILGNHDSYELFLPGNNNLCDKFKVIADILDIRVDYKGKEYQVNLCHYPILDWNHMYHGGIHIHGHTHGHLDNWTESNNRLMVDVGYNSNISREYGSFIIPFSYIIEHFDKKTSGIKYSKWAGEKYHEPEFWCKNK